MYVRETLVTVSANKVLNEEDVNTIIETLIAEGRR